jgi:site-specific recombinase XerD
MKWGYWLELYLRTHCVARGLSPRSIAAYSGALKQFRVWCGESVRALQPDAVVSRNVLEYLEHLRRDRDNGPAAVNRTVTILRNFYRAIVAMGHLDPRLNPMAGFPKIKAAARKLPTILDTEETTRLIGAARPNTVLGVRDRAIVGLLYGTGIRATECAELREGRVDLRANTVTVRGKGGHERTVPFNDEVAALLREYIQVRGLQLPQAPFFRSKFGKNVSRGTIYERIRTLGRRARISKPLSPHRLRHTFASHLVREGINLVTIRDLLGHRQITSTQVYLHVTAQDLRSAAEKHPIARLLGTIEHLLPNVRLPFQRPGARCASG